MLKNLQMTAITTRFKTTRFKRMFKLVGYSFLTLFLALVLSACGLISAKPTKTIEAEPFVEEVQNEEADADVASIDKVTASNTPQLANVTLRLLALEQQTAKLNQTKQQLQQSHGYYWLDGVVKGVQTSENVVNQSTNQSASQTASQTVKWIEVESIYDGERYIVTANSLVTATPTLLDSIKVDQFVYLDGFYDTFSGFVATANHDSNDLLEATITKSSNVPNTTRQYDFGQVASANKRRQVIALADGKEAIVNNQSSFYDAYSKQTLSKNAFWRALSEDDTVFLIATNDTSPNADSEALEIQSDTQLNVVSVWLLDKQANNRAVIGTVKQVNDTATQIVLASNMWLLKDNGLADSQVAEVSLRLGRKSQLISSDGRILSERQGLAERQALIPGQHIVVEGIQKNRLLEVERLYLMAEKNIPVYAYGTVTGHQLADNTIDLTVEWMFGSEPSEILELSVNDFTELLEIGDDKASLSSTEFWNLLSLNDDIEVEGQMVGNSLEASRLFLGNKQLEVQTLSGTVDAIQNEQMAFRLYSYADSNTAVLEKPAQDLIDLRLASDVTIEDIHLVESIIVTEFWRRLEPSDQLTVTGYFENDSFVAKSVKFEDKDTTPFVFGEVEAFEATNKLIMLKGKNQIVVVNDMTTIKHTDLGNLSKKTFWSKLNIGDNIDIEGSYKEGVFVAKKVFLSSKTQKDMKILKGEILAFNIKTSSLQIKEVDGFVVNVSVAKDSVLLEKNGKLYSQEDFWKDITLGQQVNVEGERLGSIMQANYITLDNTPVKKDSFGFFDWLTM